MTSRHADAGRHAAFRIRLDTFIDAAFAFAVTLLVIAGDHIPTSIEALFDAVRNIPAFALGFMLIYRFWSGHAQWSSRYGLDTPFSRVLGIALVFLVLVFVYPMRMVFDALCAGLSGGYLPAHFTITRAAEVPQLFIVFGAAFGSMGATMVLLHLEAWRHRDALGLDAAARRRALFEVLEWGLVPLLAAASIATALAMPLEAGLMLGLPGYLYLLLYVLSPLVRRIARRGDVG